MSCLERELRLDEVLDKIQMKEDTTAISKLMGVSGMQSTTNLGTSLSDSIRRVQTKQRGKGPEWSKREHQGSKHSRNFTSRDQKTCPHCGNREHIGGHRCFATDRRCNKCGNLGHYSRCCKSKSVKLVKDDSDKQSDSHDNDDCVWTVHDSISSVSIVKGKNNQSQNKTIVHVNGIEVQAVIDTGSSVTILDKDTYEKLGRPKLMKAGNTLYPFGVKESLSVKGNFVATVESKHKTVQAEILIVKGPRVVNIVSETLSLDLGLIKYIRMVDSETESGFPSLFTGFGKLKDYKVKIHVDESIRQGVQKSQKIPFALTEKVDQKLEELVSLDIVEQVSETPSW